MKKFLFFFALCIYATSTGMQGKKFFGRKPLSQKPINEDAITAQSEIKKFTSVNKGS